MATTIAMKADDFLYDFHTIFEGKASKPYRDSGGVLTIGVGHTNTKSHPFTSQSNWSDSVIHAAWERDISVAERLANSWITGMSVSQPMFDALVDLAFNVGQRPDTMLKHLRRNETELAARQLLRWVYCRSNILLGLVRRRLAMYTHVTGGDWERIANLNISSKNLAPINAELEHVNLKLVLKDYKLKYVYL